MKIGILGAMQEEIDGIKHYFSTSPHKFLGSTIIADRAYHQFSTGKHEIILVFSRWGKVAAAVTATTLIDKFEVDAIIFSGVAGAAHADLNVGDIVIGDQSLQHDMDISPIPRMKRFQIPLTDIIYFKSHPVLVKLAQRAANAVINMKLEKLPIKQFNQKQLRLFIGTLASGDQFIADKVKVAELEEAIDNLYAVDMESAAVAQVCMDYKLPFVAIRVISDKADGSAHIDFVKFTKELASPLDALIVEQLIKIMPDKL